MGWGWRLDVGVFCLIGFLPLDRILLLAHPLLTQQIQSKEASLLYKKQRAWLENTSARQNLQKCSCHSKNTHCLHEYRYKTKQLRMIQLFSLFKGKSYLKLFLARARSFGPTQSKVEQKECT